jgi:hypothetical protein
MDGMAQLQRWIHLNSGYFIWAQSNIVNHQVWFCRFRYVAPVAGHIAQWPGDKSAKLRNCFSGACLSLLSDAYLEKDLRFDLHFTRSLSRVFNSTSCRP